MDYKECVNLVLVTLSVDDYINDVHERYYAAAITELRNTLDKVVDERSRVLYRVKELMGHDFVNLATSNDLKEVSDSIKRLNDYVLYLNTGIDVLKAQIRDIENQNHVTAIYTFNGDHFIEKRDYDYIVFLDERLKHGDSVEECNDDDIILQVKRDTVSDLLDWEFGE